MIDITNKTSEWEHDNSSLGRPMLASHWPTLGNYLVLQARLMHDLYTQYKPPLSLSIILTHFAGSLCELDIQCATMPF